MTGQRVDWTWNIPLHLPRWMHIQSSFYYQQWIVTWRSKNLSRRQSVFFLLVDPRDESHRDREYIDFSVPRLARYLHSAWTKHQDAVIWVDINLAIQRRINILLNTIECNYYSRDTSSLLHSKS